MSEPGRHTCHIYESSSEATELAARFLTSGAARGERCVYVGAAPSRAALAKALADVSAAAAIELVPDETVFLSDGRFDPDGTLAAIEGVSRDARARGLGGVCIVSDPSSAIGRAPSVERLVEYEARVDLVLDALGVTALCQYDRAALPAPLIRGAIRVHDALIHRGRRLRNVHAVPPPALLQTESAEAEVERLLATLHAHEEAEDALRTSERRHRLLSENAADVIFRYRLAPTRGFEYVSPSSVTLHGYTPEEHYADPDLAFRITHPDDRPRLAQMEVEDPSTLTAPLVLRWIAKDGRTIWTEQRIVLLRDDAGNIVAIEGVARDVTARKAAEDALRESEERLRIALESAGHLFWEYDVPSQRVLSGITGKLLGHTERGVRSVDEWIALVHEEDRERMLAALRAHLSGETPQYRCEYRARDAAGAWRWVLASGRVLSRDAAGRPLRMAGTLTDVTETRQLRQQLQTADRLASVGTLAAGVAHEINNPLAFVTSNLGYLRDELGRLARGDEPATAATFGGLQDAIRDALDGTVRVRGIVQGLREFAQPARETEREAARAPVDVRAEIVAAVGLTRNEIAHRAILALDLAEDLPRVVAAPHELGQVLVNLLVNAVQAIPEGRAAWNEVRVTARAERGEVLIEVRDSGAGISADALPHIFDPFFTTKGVGGGTGLGLSICHGIVVALAGRIEVDTAPGRGTTFRVTLPATPPAVRPAAAPPTAAPARARARVLVVDDEPLVGRSLVRLLQSAHDVTALASPAEALQRLSAGERWDVVLCDLMMPEMSGMDLEARLASAAPDVVPRIVYMTGGAFTERARAFLEEGRPFLEKPVDPAVLRAKIADVARAGRGLAA